ncbi:HalOD1 output domain-containing protein [Haloarcula sediminis]|uniref:HalOD1 output domain-containing protein n=1 Tax=Haloarcula sediminis TaxID=3111777 RepID=UPI002D775955|nr:HalOD1 output domain-containing protein [Haloarcula sp. CK38]
MDIETSIARKVASREGTSPTALRPLYEVIDTDALRRVMDSTGDVRVEFTYSGYAVAVTGDGSIHLDASGDAGGP